MKVVVIQETVMMPDLTPEEVTAHWNKLKEIPGVELEIKYPKGYPMPDELHELVGDAEIVFGIWISDMVINEEWLSHHPNLKYIATLGHGWREFDVEMTRRKGMTITNTVYGAQTIAEYGWALLMEVCHHVNAHSDIIKKTDWSIHDENGRPVERAKFDNVVTPQIELYGKTCGIFGLGAIGLAFAKMAAGFGMRVISYSRHKKVGAIYSFIEQVDFETLLKESDVISIHAPFTADTADTFDKEAFAKMKDGVILINTARGGLIVEEDLMAALESGKVYGAGLDVLREEPPLGDNPLFHTDKTSITGHIAWLTKASRLRAVDMAIENFQHYLNGIPTSVIN
ncbi:MAG: D-2-hydroxyacid dehydrogenase [Treponema sp.]|nr:D-2-hydroxyacid dehydrogenase [Treponema sp.]